jgi:hypothetical protein
LKILIPPLVYRFVLSLFLSNGHAQLSKQSCYKLLFLHLQVGLPHPIKTT